MKKLTKAAVALFALSMLAVGANAGAPPKSMVCPSCHMTMYRTKSKSAPIAVKTKNGTYYCCAGCASGKAAAKKAKKK